MSDDDADVDPSTLLSQASDTAEDVLIHEEEDGMEGNMLSGDAEEHPLKEEEEEQVAEEDDDAASHNSSENRINAKNKRDTPPLANAKDVEEEEEEDGTRESPPKKQRTDPDDKEEVMLEEEEEEMVEKENNGSRRNGRKTKKKKRKKRDDSDDDADASLTAPNPFNGALGGSRHINVAGKPAEAGIILKIYVENFMCHKKLTVDLCRNINFIYGQNGSGKVRKSGRKCRLQRFLVTAPSSPDAPINYSRLFSLPFKFAWVLVPAVRIALAT
jgi:AAA domain